MIVRWQTSRNGRQHRLFVGGDALLLVMLDANGWRSYSDGPLHEFQARSVAEAKRKALAKLMRRLSRVAAQRDAVNAWKHVGPLRGGAR